MPSTNSNRCFDDPTRSCASLLAGLWLAASVHAETWRFAVIGDTPYSAYERSELPRMLDDIADEHPGLIVHAGDFKDSRTICSDELFRDRHTLFAASRVPLLYVVGDNEWTDCRQLAAGHFDPLERLQKLRELFFAEPRSLGRQTLPVEQQAKAPEHLRWRLGPVLFLSLNVPGPNNHFGLGKPRPARNIWHAIPCSSTGSDRDLPLHGENRPPAWSSSCRPTQASNTTRPA
jgi:hypothetical protein